MTELAQEAVRWVAIDDRGNHPRSAIASHLAAEGLPASVAVVFPPAIGERPHPSFEDVNDTEVRLLVLD
jgi:hypothetical protein